MAEDEQLIFKKLKNEDGAAYKTVYMDNRELFLNFGRKYSLDTEDLLDIYQDAYVIFYENILQGKLTVLHSKISTYLIGIGRLLIMNRLRKNRKTVSIETFMMPVETESTLEQFEIEKEPLSEKQVLLKKYFEQLGEKCREMLILFYYKKQSIRQIMDTGGYASENVVKSQKSRCLKTLREQITQRLV